MVNGNSHSYNEHMNILWPRERLVQPFWKAKVNYYF
jgi:hypothetical protein